MDIATLALFAGALLVLFLTPGPGIAVAVARTLDSGWVNASFYWAGILTGDIFWFTLAVTGLAALAEQLGPVWTVVKFAGAAYLVWLSARAFQSAWTGARPKPVFKAGSTRGLAGTYLLGVAMPLSNPKPIVFYLTLVPAFIPVEAITAFDYVLMVAIMAVMAVPVGLIYIGGSHWAREAMNSPRVRRGADIVTGVLMAAIALLLLLR